MPRELTKVPEESDATSLTVELTPQSNTGIFDKYRVRIWNSSRVGIEDTTPMAMK